MAMWKKIGRKMQRGKESLGKGLGRSMSFGQTNEEGLLRSGSFGMGNEEFGMVGLVRSTSFGRKRVSFSVDDIMEFESFNSTPSKKKQCSTSHSPFCNSEKSALEALPQDILIRILCGVDHDDLKNLFQVSKSIRECTLIVKEWHFAYSTPTKTLRFGNAMDMDDLDEAEAAMAPKQTRVPRSQLSRKKLKDISVALFTSDGEENWPRRELFMDMETDI